MAVAAPARYVNSHEVVSARYHNVDPVYAETRDIRLLGFVFFLMSDCVLFGAFIFAYLYLRTSAPTWPPIVDGTRLPWFDTAFATLNSVVLFGSGVTMHFALESWKHLNRAKFKLWIISTIVLGIGFLLGQAHEYSLVIKDGVAWGGAGASAMGASFFTLTGMHGIHVFIGVCFLITLYIQTERGVYTGSKYFGLTAGTLYWHFVDVIWVLLFFLFYLW
jgi:heme/copper-type cytochrome/quinol oxidase subunit 3